MRRCASATLPWWLGALGDDVRLEPPANQRNVADDVAGLVADELIGPAQRGAHHAVVGEDDDVLDVAAQGEAALPQPGHLALEAEGARPGDLPPEAVGVDRPLAGLPPDDAGDPSPR